MATFWITATSTREIVPVHKKATYFSIVGVVGIVSLPLALAGESCVFWERSLVIDTSVNFSLLLELQWQIDQDQHKAGQAILRCLCFQCGTGSSSHQHAPTSQTPSEFTSGLKITQDPYRAIWRGRGGLVFPGTRLKLQKGRLNYWILRM